MPRSRVTLPKLESPPATIADYLIWRFPHVSEPMWRDRFARGLITIGEGVALREDDPYRHGLLVFYEREVPQEPEPPEAETILFQDSEILVADKPHGMPVTPAGNYVARSLLSRLERNTGLDTLAPLHRLDRDTAGLVLFSVNAASRARYHALFARREMEREYLAVARVVAGPDQKHWLVENRIVPGTPWFRRQIVEGPVNAITEIELIDVREGLGRFRLRPKTGKKHQLRIHMAAIGFPILGDRYYPNLDPPVDPAPASLPLQLLACALSFTDPVTAVRRDFRSTKNLLMF
jgi:tRNA pseudouridine32 synthase/23S rRNA pseudouridine746 synthase